MQKDSASLASRSVGDIMLAEEAAAPARKQLLNEKRAWAVSK